MPPSLVSWRAWRSCSTPRNKPEQNDFLADLHGVIVGEIQLAHRLADIDL